jgi:DNA invertase Pin-like site-specific DNA recombinase
MRAAVYLRVSKDNGTQDEQNQEPDCLRICAARGWEPVVFREQESAVKHRPEWERLKVCVHRGEVGAVVAWALDRMGRDRVKLAHDVAELARKGAAVLTVREPWLDQPVGALRDLLIQLMGWFAQSERERLIERTKAGQARAKKEGKHIGRKWTDPADVEKIRKCHVKGTSAFLAAKELNIPESTVRTYFKRWDKDSTFNPYPRQVVKG